MQLYFTQSGFYKHEVGTSEFTPVPLPAGVTVPTPVVRPDTVLWPGLNTLLIVGQFSSNLVWRSDTEVLGKMGIAAPSGAPTLNAGAGVGITGLAIGKYTFAEMDGAVVVRESNGSPASGTVNLVNKNRVWTVLPTTCADALVTHKRLYVSMDGANYKFVANVPLATAAYTEAIPTASLGVELSSANGVPPLAKYVTIYHRRAWFADGTDTYWWSELDKPESVASTSFGKTLDGRKITSIRGLTDQLCVMSRLSFQSLQGWTSDDFSLSMVTPSIGCISHHGAQVVNDKLWFPAQDGYYRYGGGGFQHLMPGLRSYFRSDYIANASEYQDCIARVDREKHVFKVLIPKSNAFYYVGHYLDSEVEFGGAGTLPSWTFDKRTRYDYAIATLTNGELYDEFYTGGSDGYVRKENQDSVDNDDDDGFKKAVTLQTKHFWLPDQCGTEDHGAKVENLDAFVKTEEQDTTVSFYGGDEDAVNAATPSRTITIEASALTRAGTTYTAKSSHHKAVGSAGKGVTVKYTVDNPVDWEYRGQSILWQPGEQVRPEST